MRTSGVSHDTALLRRLNTRATLQVLRQGGAQTLTQLARAAGLSRQTAEVAIADLTERGLAEEAAPTEGGAGRPARRFRFRAEAGHVVGVDIGPRRIFAMLADLNGDVLTERRLDVDEHLPAAERLALAEQAATACAADVSRGGVWAATAGTSGVVDRSGRVSVSHLIPGWTGLDLGGQVGRWFDCPGFAANDANLAALAEHWRGSARHVDDMVYVLSGYRAGHGLMLDGRLRAGRTGSAGELGRLPLVGWEDMSVVLARDGRDAEEVFEAARAGEERALAVVDRLAYGLARGASALVLVVDPELVVVGGGFSRAGELLLGPMRTHLAGMCLNPPEVALSTFGEESIALGGVRMALDHVERERLDL
ncbi:ROK family protein [Microtetraspora malaysiensis]|uniref:ROK family protein n=1 Tax=Microtetraspora malaysiensis TaxID=161358 RepID=UPI00082C2904|nr:ROK family protein [Microtetraspora malaysiensis]